MALAGLVHVRSYGNAPGETYMLAVRIAMDSEATTRPLEIPVDKATLRGDLFLPRDAAGLVIFAHGSGSSRHSPRNQSVAEALHRSGLGTLLFDLLTEREEEEERYTHHLRFDIPLLAGRLVGVTDWLHDDGMISGLGCGYFGASTGAAAALIAAAERPALISAVVSRGGRPDLAAEALGRVRAPTLLIVGGADTPVIEMNRWAMERLTGVKQLTIVPGATHLFEERGTLEEVARLAADWFLVHLSRAGRDGA